MTVTRRLLTAITVQKAKPTHQDYKLSDGHGLSLYVTPSGTKIWRCKNGEPCRPYELTNENKVILLDKIN